MNTLFPYKYVGGGYFRKTDVKVGEQADTLHGMEAIEHLYKKMSEITSHESEISESDNYICNKYGWCYYRLIPNEYPAIFNLYIHKPHRRQGHARHLIKLVINEIRSTGYTGKIMIYPDPREDSITKEDLIAFYEDLGLTILVTNLLPRFPQKEGEQI